MSTNRSLIVPIDKQGMADYENDVTKTDGLKPFILPESEFNLLFKSGYFADLNARFNLLIDDYEEEVIPPTALEYAKKQLNELTANCPIFSEALNYAIQQNTELCLEF